MKKLLSFVLVSLVLWSVNNFAMAQDPQADVLAITPITRFDAEVDIGAGSEVAVYELTNNTTGPLPSITIQNSIPRVAQLADGSSGTCPASPFTLAAKASCNVKFQENWTTADVGQTYSDANIKYCPPTPGFPCSSLPPSQAKQTAVVNRTGPTGITGSTTLVNLSSSSSGSSDAAASGAVSITNNSAQTVTVSATIASTSPWSSIATVSPSSAQIGANQSQVFTISIASGATPPTPAQQQASPVDIRFAASNTNTLPIRLNYVSPSSPILPPPPAVGSGSLLFTSTGQQTISFTNTTGSSIVLGQASLGTQLQNVTIASDNCSGQKLASGYGCQIAITAAANSSGADYVSVPYTISSNNATGSLQELVQSSLSSPSSNLELVDNQGNALPFISVTTTAATQTIYIKNTGSSTVDSLFMATNPIASNIWLQQTGCSINGKAATTPPNCDPLAAGQTATITLAVTGTGPTFNSGDYLNVQASGTQVLSLPAIGANSRAFLPQPSNSAGESIVNTYYNNTDAAVTGDPFSSITPSSGSLENYLTLTNNCSSGVAANSSCTVTLTIQPQASIATLATDTYTYTIPIGGGETYSYQQQISAVSALETSGNLAATYAGAGKNATLPNAGTILTDGVFSIGPGNEGGNGSEDSLNGVAVNSPANNVMIGYGKASYVGVSTQPATQYNMPHRMLWGSFGGSDGPVIFSGTRTPTQVRNMALACAADAATCSGMILGVDQNSTPFLASISFTNPGASVGFSHIPKAPLTVTPTFWTVPAAVEGYDITNFAVINNAGTLTGGLVVFQNLNSQGSIDTMLYAFTLNGNTPTFTQVADLQSGTVHAVQCDATISECWVGGSFSYTYGGTTYYNLAQVNPAATTPALSNVTGFGATSTSSSIVYDLQYRLAHLIVGGANLNATGVTSAPLAIFDLNSSWTAPSSFTPTAPSIVYKIANNLGVDLTDYSHLTQLNMVGADSNGNLGQYELGINGTNYKWNVLFHKISDAETTVNSATGSQVAQLLYVGDLTPQAARKKFFSSHLLW